MSAVDAVTPVEEIPPIRRDEAGALAATEHARYVELLRGLSDEDWAQPTACPAWDVRSMAGHSIGMMADFTSLRAVLRRMRAAGAVAKRQGVAMVDAMTAQQVETHAGLSTAELIARGEEVGPRAARWRAGGHRLLRRLPIREEIDGTPETWRFSYLLDVILTRDPWMHRTDIAEATGRPLVLTPEHDGRLVADVVADWARRHGRPFRLTLTGPAGGAFRAGDGDEELTLDAVEFCRILSGRAPGHGLLARPVPF